MSKGYRLEQMDKGMVTLTPTSVGVDDINDADEAVRLLQEMAEKQRPKI